MRKDKNYVFLWIDLLIAALLLALDQFTKYLVTLHLKNQPPLVLIDSISRTQGLRSVCFRIGNPLF